MKKLFIMIKIHLYMSILIIVESPAKAKKIQSFLGKDYIVLSSYGHICNLDVKKGKNAVEVDNNFKLNFSNLPDKKKVINQLLTAKKKVKKVIIATDEDREGEAIGYHLIKLLKLDLKITDRILFNEITKKAILKSLDNPIKLRMNFVYAQFCRMALDHIIGFRLSPLLWNNINGPKGLSGGRVQSVLTKIVIEKKEKHDSFDENNYYKINGDFVYSNKNYVIKSSIKNPIENYIELLKLSIGTLFKITNISIKKIERKPPPPYTTSSLQQDISSKIGISTAIVMKIAQELYEKGHITYHRTDSVNLSVDFISNAKNYIIKHFGKEYSNTRNFKNNSTNAQEAHEAIRPTNIDRNTLDIDDIKNKVYCLIWKRATASQMSNEVLNNIVIEINCNKYKNTFLSSNDEILFQGFKILYNSTYDNNYIEFIKTLKKGMELTYNKISAEEQVKNKPDVYTESSLVKELEKKGIGRPSTYATMIQKVQIKNYVSKSNLKGTKRKFTNFFIDQKKLFKEEIEKQESLKKNRLLPTKLGIDITNFLVKNFGDTNETHLMNYNFTAKLEKDLDLILDGKINWIKVLENFYKDFFPIYNKLIMQKSKTSNDFDEGRFIGNYPKTNERVTVRIGKFGPVAQIGEYSKAKGIKPKYINIDGFDLETVTLEDVLKKAQFPKKIGRYENFDIIIFDGKYGYYIKWNGNNCSMNENEKEDIDSIDENKGIEIIKRKLSSSTGPVKQLLNGKVSINKSKFESSNKYYLTYREGYGRPINISIPNNKDINDIDDDYVKKLIDSKQ